ncbi:ATP-binding protein [Spongiactinospora sp. TRM90649]|uniref:AAA family ATPase n=1 Tax=Spongiactinospora sp. TRM90649 TaxID=3031114 RepID=UPI0023F851D6|nr:ATP-binding protein [Spongiactinospora sp. TRM90649]MDF5755870.1 ATP-binding protein [Spongiactinospora sp. TRM90649]
MDLSDARRLAGELSDLLAHANQRLEEGRKISPAVSLVTDHLECELTEVVSVSETFPRWEHANLQQGVDAYLAERSPGAEWTGLTVPDHGHFDYITMLTMAARGWERFEPGAVDYATASTGPAQTMEVVARGLVRTHSPGGEPVVLGVRASEEHGPPECRIELLAVSREAAREVRDEVTRLMRLHDVFRGQVLSFVWTEHRHNDLVGFLPRPSMTADEVILPPGVLRGVERHVIEVGELAARLREHGQHLKRGLLLHGPPGSGKTHTVRYLMGRMTGCTVIVLTGTALQRVEEAAGLARRLQPALVVLEDVDLVAMDRSYTPDGNPLLFMLLDAMDGIGADADVAFVLTTNRADVLEHALADRPGRIDLAVEIPKPDADGREALLRLYTRGLRLTAPLAPIVARTEGATASFFKELVRRAVTRAILADDAGALTDEHLTGALDEMLGERQALTRALLGSGGGEDGTEPVGDDGYARYGPEPAARRAVRHVPPPSQIGAHGTSFVIYGEADD